MKVQLTEFHGYKHLDKHETAFTINTLNLKFELLISQVDLDELMH